MKSKASGGWFPSRGEAPRARRGHEGGPIREPTPHSAVDRRDANGATGEPSSGAGGVVETIQTPLSHLVLTGDRVYKWRRPVKLPFLDFTDRKERTRDCLREVALNRRLAPDVYLGIAAGEAGSTPGPVQETPTQGREHCVVMRRLAHGRDARSLLEAGALRADAVDALARRLAAFHDANRLASGDGLPERIERLLADNLALLAEAPDLVGERDRIRLEQGCSDLLAARRGDLAARERAGCGVEGHGDLRLEHVWCEEGADDPVAIDCAEFEAAFRRLDAAVDPAFLVSDLHLHRAPALAHRFLRHYAEASDDYDVFTAIDLYIAYAALVRAKVAALAAREADSERTDRPEHARCRALVKVALAALEERLPAQRGGRVVLMTGIVASGKSTVASALAELTGGVAIRSDAVRDRALGAETADPARRYDHDAKDRVYAAMLARAEPVVRSGRAAILDATHARARWRRDAIAWARARALPFHVVETRCEASEAMRRLRRRREGSDSAFSSEAGPERYRDSAREFEPVAGVPDDRHCVIEHGDPEADRRLLRVALDSPRSQGVGS